MIVRGGDSDPSLRSWQWRSSTMRVGFDLRPSYRKNSRRRGVGKYTFWLAEELLKDATGPEFLLYKGKGQEATLPGAGNSHQIELPELRLAPRLNWLLDRVFLERRLAQDGLALFHATDITSIPRVRRCQVWAHVHDLIPFLFWKDTRRWLPWDYVQALRLARGRMRRADLIITDSEHSKKDICEQVGRREDDVKVIYPSCGPDFGPRDKVESRKILKRQYSIDQPFLFYVGGSDSRKNLPRLLTSFRMILDQGYPGKLVLAGESFLWDIEEVRVLRQQIERQRMAADVVFPGYVPDALLPNFYSACDLFVFPSLYEGFGLPVLEAIRCETKVLASRSSSIPEVAGKAAAYFDPRDEESLVQAFKRLYEAPHEPLQRECRRQSQRFSWKKAVQEILELYVSRT